MAQMLSRTFSWLIILFMMATTAPLFVEVWIEQGFCAAICRLFKQMITGAPLHFMFQAKIIGVYTTDEIRYGGASYLPTGRGLPTERRPFFGSRDAHGNFQAGGLYLDWAQHAFYDAFRLWVTFVLVILSGGLAIGKAGRWSLVWWCASLVLTAFSWLYAPFIFNPYQFAHSFFWKDFMDWKELFLGQQGKSWKEWHEKTQLGWVKAEPTRNLRATVMDAVGWMFYLGCWYTVLNSKMYILTSASGVNVYTTQVWALFPPIGASLSFCCVVTLIKYCSQDQRDIHLAILALVVSVLDVGEAVISLRQLILMNGSKVLLLAWCLNMQRAP